MASSRRMTVGGEMTRRGPGRPRQTDEETQRVRERIIAATELTFARDGYRGVTATRVIEEAGLTRTNFYRYFRSVEEPLMVVCDRFSEDLARTIAEAVSSVPPGPRSIVLGMDGYLDWARRYRHLLPSVMAEVHVPGSVIAVRRRQALDMIISMITRFYEESGRPVASRSTLDVFVNAVEYTCLRLHLDTPGGETDVAEARETMQRMAIAVLGGPNTWRRQADVIERRRAEAR
jgi:AcrR family transcriptional regulator